MTDVLAVRDAFRAKQWALAIQECNASGLALNATLSKDYITIHQRTLQSSEGSGKSRVIQIPVLKFLC